MVTPTRLITDRRNLALANGLTGKKNALVKCRQLHLQLNTLRCLSVATDRDIQGWSAGCNSIHRPVVIRTFCIVSLWETHPWGLLMSFRHITLANNITWLGCTGHVMFSVRWKVNACELFRWVWDLVRNAVFIRSATLLRRRSGCVLGRIWQWRTVWLCCADLRGSCNIERTAHLYATLAEPWLSRCAHCIPPTCSAGKRLPAENISDFTTNDIQHLFY